MKQLRCVRLPRPHLAWTAPWERSRVTHNVTLRPHGTYLGRSVEPVFKTMGFLLYFIYLKEREVGILCWFSPQMPATTGGAGLGWPRTWSLELILGLSHVGVRDPRVRPAPASSKSMS